MEAVPLEEVPEAAVLVAAILEEAHRAAVLAAAILEEAHRAAVLAAAIPEAAHLAAAILAAARPGTAVSDSIKSCGTTPAMARGQLRQRPRKLMPVCGLMPQLVTKLGG
jgi:hypothetical protein